MKRLLSLLLVLAMVLSMVPAVFAQEWEGEIDPADPIEPEIETIEIEDINGYTNVVMNADGEESCQLVWVATESGTLKDIYPKSAYYNNYESETPVTYTITLNDEAIDLTAEDAAYEIEIGDALVIIPVVTAVDGAPEVSFDVNFNFVGAPGTANNPIEISPAEETYTTDVISANDIVYYTVVGGNGYTLTIENARNIAVRSGFQYVAADPNGVITMELSAFPPDSPIGLMIIADAEAEAATYTMTFTAPAEGSEMNPKYLNPSEMGEVEAPLSADLNYMYVYQWDTYEDGQLIITYDESRAPEGSEIAIMVQGPGFSKNFEDAAYNEEGMLVLTVDVTALNPYAEEEEYAVYNIVVMDHNNVATSVPFTVEFTAARYTVTWEESDEYTIWASKTADIVPGDDVTVFVSAKDGYKLGDAVVKANGEAVEAVAPGVYVVTVNADTVITVEGASAEAPAPVEDPKVAIVGDDTETWYSLNDAIAKAAETGTAAAPVTVKLVANADMTGKDITVKPGVTLDIANCVLRADNLVVIKGGNLFSSKRLSTNAGYGKVIVPDKSNLVISTESALPTSGGNSALPIWVPAANAETESCYALVNAQIQDSTSDPYVLDKENHTVNYTFKHTGGGALNPQFADNGSADNGIRFCVMASWFTGKADVNLNFWFTDGMVHSVANGQWCTFQLSGLDILGANYAENEAYDTFVVKAALVTDAGVCVFGNSK